MKTLLGIAALLAFAASPALAIVQTGFHLGIDRNGHETYEREFGSDLGDDEVVTIFSHDIKDPILAGVHLFVDILPFIDLEAGIESSFAKYKYEYQAAGLALRDQEVTYGRIALYGSGKFHFISLPMFRLYVGGGAGYHLITPLFGEELVREELESGGDYDLDLGDILSRRSHFGLHVLGGVRLQPVFLPFALSLEGRYFMLPENEFGDETNKFLSFTLGLDFGA